MFLAFKRSESMGAVIKHLDTYRITKLSLIRTDNNIIVLLQASQGMYSFKRVGLHRDGQSLCPLWLEILTLD